MNMLTVQKILCSEADYEKSKDVTDEANATVENILVSPDCQTGWKDAYIDKLIDEKLTAVNLKMIRIQINRRRGSFISSLVQIEPVLREKVNELDFAARNRNWKLEIMK